jgi:CHAD domain-containing protein
VIHKFRTQSRRVETILREISKDGPRYQQKLSKQLCKLRKKTGRVRDLDVQVTMLRNLKIPQAAKSKSRLIRDLLDERLQREKQVSQSLDKKTVRDLRKRLKRLKTDLQLSPGIDLLSTAKRILDDLVQVNSAPDERMLHRYRVVGKRARYVAEMSSDEPNVREFVGQLKNLQDILGEWHDWLQLTERAKRTFGSAEKSPLFAALQNITRTKFHQAVNILNETRNSLQQAPGSAPVPRKPQASVQAKAAVA